MIVARSKNRRPKTADADIREVLGGVSAERLRASVKMISFPRHYIAERKANIRARDLLIRELTGFGYIPQLQGTCDNIVVSTGEDVTATGLLIAAIANPVLALIIAIGVAFGSIMLIVKVRQLLAKLLPSPS